MKAATMNQSGVLFKMESRLVCEAMLETRLCPSSMQLQLGNTVGSNTALHSLYHPNSPRVHWPSLQSRCSIQGLRLCVRLKIFHVTQ